MFCGCPIRWLLTLPRRRQQLGLAHNRIGSLKVRWEPSVQSMHLTINLSRAPAPSFIMVLITYTQNTASKLQATYAALRQSVAGRRAFHTVGAAGPGGRARRAA
jgi:hypothetical protein